MSFSRRLRSLDDSLGHRSRARTIFTRFRSAFCIRQRYEIQHFNNNVAPVMYTKERGQSFNMNIRRSIEECA